MSVQPNSDKEGGPVVVISTCPTGGWVMNNRKRIEAEVLKKMPNAKVKHTCALCFTDVTSVDGKKGKRDCCPMLFCCPSCCTCVKTDKYGEEGYLPAAAGAPEAAEMVR